MIRLNLSIIIASWILNECIKNSSYLMFFVTIYIYTFYKYLYIYIYFSVGTFNLQGCSSKLRWQLASDNGKYKISVYCLQETKSNYLEETINGINLKFLNPQNKQTGMGFAIKKKLEPLLHRI